ncbi:MAG TPA: c-type cytochrome [Pirellulales bacterium]|nr:c-type cytochrome [Pirellulales bacterium]
MTRPLAIASWIGLATLILVVLYVVADRPVYREGAQGLSLYRVDGQGLYERHCSICHGENGRGDGQVASSLTPRPRDFAVRGFRLVSTDNGYPSKDDILKVLEHGMAGTNMPAWGHLPEADRDALADYVLKLARQGMREREYALLAEEFGDDRTPEDEEEIAEELDSVIESQTSAGEAIPIPPEPPVTDKQLARGKEIFTKDCVKCHGDDGTGRDDPEWRTAEGFPIVSGNLRRGIFKGGSDRESVYRRVAAGIPGTPMPGSSETMTGDDIWSIVQYTLSLSDEAARERGCKIWTPPKAEGMPEGDAEIGRKLISGAVRFSNGAPSCRGCHSISGLRDPGGGAWGPDLTNAYRKFGDVMTYWPENVAPMKSIYTAKPLTPQEKADLSAALYQGWEQVEEEWDTDRPAPVLTATANLLALGIGLLVAIGFTIVGRVAGIKRMELQ